MKNSKLLLSSCALLVSAGINAQIVCIPMQPAGNSIEETVSGKPISLSSALAPYTVAGAKGDAWRLDGYSSFAHGDLDLSALDGKSQLTFSLWVAPETYPMMRLDENGEWFTTMAGSMRIDDDNKWDNTTAKGFAFQLGSHGSYMFICFSNGFQLTAKASAKLSRYEWNHLVAVFDGPKKRVTLYNNGVEVGSAKAGQTFTSKSNELFVGKSFKDDKTGECCLNTFNGLIDDFDVYDGVRDDIISDTPDNLAVLTYSAYRYADDICRPSFHGMPTAAWTNETHGAVYYNGKYHLFFQKNPNGLYLSHMHWGHLVSDNLYLWEEMPTAISPGDDVTWYDRKGCWSGCVYMDDYLTDGKPNIFYTGVDYARAMISQATPSDEELKVWNKVEANPIVDGRPDGLGDDFRDCFVFKAGDNYYMIVGSSKDGVGCATLHRYDRSTAKWSNDGSLFFKGQTATRDGNFWEMPNVTKLGDKWMFTCTPLSTANGVRTLYWTGSVNADGTFAPDDIAPKTVELEGFSKDGYGMLSPTIFTHDGKTVLLGVTPDKLPMAETYRLGYAHAYSLPREICLAADGSLVQKPFGGLHTMRTATSFSRADFTLNGTESLAPVEGRSLELSAEFTVGKGDFGFTFLGNGDRNAKLTYSPANNTVSLDLTGLDRIVQDEPFGGKYVSTLPQRLAEGSTAKLTVYVDHSFADIFVNDTYAATVRIFPTDKDGIKAAMFADGVVSVKSVNAYVLDASRTTGVKKLSAGDISVKGGKGTITYNLSKSSGDITVYDMSGRVIRQRTNVSGVGSIALAYDGISVVRVKNHADGIVNVYKVVVL